MTFMLQVRNCGYGVDKEKNLDNIRFFRLRVQGLFILGFFETVLIEKGVDFIVVTGEVQGGV